MVEWLETLGYCRQGCGFESGVGQPTTGSRWVHFSYQGRIRQLRRRVGSAFHMLCPRDSEPLTFTASTATRLLETFIYLIFFFFFFFFFAVLVNSEYFLFL